MRTAPRGDASTRRIHGDRMTTSRNTADRPKATPKCMRTPISTGWDAAVERLVSDQRCRDPLKEPRHCRSVEDGAHNAREEAIADAGRHAGAHQSRRRICGHCRTLELPRAYGRAGTAIADVASTRRLLRSCTNATTFKCSRVQSRPMLIVTSADTAGRTASATVRISRTTAAWVNVRP